MVKNGPMHRLKFQSNASLVIHATHIHYDILSDSLFRSIQFIKWMSIIALVYVYIVCVCVCTLYEREQPNWGRLVQRWTKRSRRRIKWHVWNRYMGTCTCTHKLYTQYREPFVHFTHNKEEQQGAKKNNTTIEYTLAHTNILANPYKQTHTKSIIVIKQKEERRG